MCQAPLGLPSRTLRDAGSRLPVLGPHRLQATGELRPDRQVYLDAWRLRVPAAAAAEYSAIPRPRYAAPPPLARACPARSRATPPRAAPPCQGSPVPALQTSASSPPHRGGSVGMECQEREFIPGSVSPSVSTYLLHQLRPWTEASQGTWSMFRAPGSTFQGRPCGRTGLRVQKSAF